MAYHKANESGGAVDLFIGLFIIGMILMVAIPFAPLIIALTLLLAPYIVLILLIYYGTREVSNYLRRRQERTAATKRRK